VEKLKLMSYVLFVKDVAVSKEFYEKVLDQEVMMDINGINIIFKSGLALWQKQYAVKTIFDKKIELDEPRNNLEIYFETSNLDGMFQKVQKAGTKILHPIKIQPWQQKVFRIYDPDDFIIEIAETMTEVIKHLIDSGMSFDSIAEKTFMPEEAVKSILENL
jgi:predicted enzyme related to lactoylglutathione lyase